jgi:FkbM family methyltransferase
MWDSLTAPAIFGRQDDEPRILAEYLAGKPGVFVEVGAFQPVELSLTYALEQAGWSGILIEPVAEHAASLRRQRRARVFEVACGAPENHGKLMPIRVAGGLSTMRTYDLERELAGKEVRNVRVVTLDSVLEEAGIEAIDFLSIDVEGMEVDVLRGFSSGRFRPRLALVEDRCEGLAKHRYMRSIGYRLVRRTDINSWYMPRDVAFPISLFGHWQLLRKYYLSQPFRTLRKVSKRYGNNAAS